MLTLVRDSPPASQPSLPPPHALLRPLFARLQRLPGTFLTAEQIGQEVPQTVLDAIHARGVKLAMPRGESTVSHFSVDIAPAKDGATQLWIAVFEIDRGERAWYDVQVAGTPRVHFAVYGDGGTLIAAGRRDKNGVFWIKRCF